MELSTDISQLMESERRLNESNERLRTVIGQKTCLVWEVDIRQRSFHVFDVDTQSCADQESGAKFPDAFLKGKIVHDDSAANFREFAEDILNGKPAVQAILSCGIKRMAVTAGFFFLTA